MMLLFLTISFQETGVYGSHTKQILMLSFIVTGEKHLNVVFCDVASSFLFQ